MAIDFPSSPTTGATLTSGGTTWVYNGIGWAVSPTAQTYAPLAANSLLGNASGTSATPGALALGGSLSFVGSTLMGGTGMGIGSYVNTGTYTYVLADANTFVPANPTSTGGGAFFIPDHSAVPFPIGTVLGAIQLGTHNVGILAYSTASLVGTAVAYTNGPGTSLTARQIAIDVWAVECSPSSLVINGAPFAAASSQVSTGRGVVYSQATAGVLTLDLNSGDLFYTPTAGMTANITSIVFTGILGAVTNLGQSFRMRFRQDSTGGRTVAFPSSFKFRIGSDTAVQSAAGAYTLLEATTFDNGTRWECNMWGAG